MATNSSHHKHNTQRGRTIKLQKLVPLPYLDFEETAGLMLCMEMKPERTGKSRWVEKGVFFAFRFSVRFLMPNLIILELWDSKSRWVEKGVFSAFRFSVRFPMPNLVILELCFSVPYQGVSCHSFWTKKPSSDHKLAGRQTSRASIKNNPHHSLPRDSPRMPKRSGQEFMTKRLISLDSFRTSRESGTTPQSQLARR